MWAHKNFLHYYLSSGGGNIPDIVIFYDGANDAYAAWQSGVAGVPQNENNRIAEFNALRDWRSDDLEEIVFRRIREKTIIYRSAKKLGEVFGYSQRADSPKLTDIAHADSLAKETVRAYVGNINIVKALGESYGFDSFFYWQPVVFQKKHLTKYEEEQKQAEIKVERFFSKVYGAVEMSKNLKTIEEFHDISNIFKDSEKPYFIDFVHITEDGNKIIARRVARDIYKSIKDKTGLH